MSDPAKYRTKEELEKMKTEHDPILMVKALYLKEGGSEDALKKVEQEIKTIMEDAVEFAKTSPEPDPAELWTDILVA
jgi:pyruvate dehydrogenase E1 component alpha subunit